MLTISLTISLVLLVTYADSAGQTKRGLYSLTTEFGLSSTTNLGSSSLSIPLQTYSTSGIESFLPFSNGINPVSIDLNQQANILPAVPVLSSNSLEKPVQEQPQEFAQQPTAGPAFIPYRPPPAVPVNAAAANVPTNSGAVFLGSGALGVVDLGGGAYALGSGGIGYSDVRRQPRPSGTSPIFPPLQARPNLIPAATQNQQTQQIPDISSQQFAQWSYDSFSQPSNGQTYVPPGQTGFGEEPFMLRQQKTRNAYATPTVEQIQSQILQPGQQAMSAFGDPVPQIIDLAQPLDSQQLSNQQRAQLQQQQIQQPQQQHVLLQQPDQQSQRPAQQPQQLLFQPNYTK